MTRSAVLRTARRAIFPGPARLFLALICGACAAAPESSSWIGINTHLGHPDFEGRWRSAKTSPKDRDIYFGLLEELKVPLMRDLFMCWGRVQPQPDAKYDFSFSDDLVRRAQNARVEVLALCWGVPRWAAAGQGTGSVDFGVPAREHAEAFRRFVRAFVERYNADGLGDMAGLREPIRAYEFMNEMEQVPPAEYAYWLKIFRETVKSVDPRARVVLGGLRSPGLHTVGQPEGDYPTYFDRLLAEPELAGNGYPHFDVVSFHNYPASYPGRGEFDDAVAYLRSSMAARGLSLPLWLTEYGYNSGTREEERQKDSIVQWAIRARAIGIDRIYLYCLWDYHWAGEIGAGENMGLVREVASEQAPSKKPAFRAFATLIREIQQRPRVTRRGESLYVLTGAGEPTYVIWRDESYDPSEVLIPGWWDVRTLNGRSYVRQGAAITLTESPVFLQRQRSPFID